MVRCFIAPVASAQLHNQAAGEARHARRRRGRGGREGVVLEEAEDHDNVPVTVDDADEEDQVDDLAYAYL